MATNGEFSWPPAGSFVSAYGENLMSAGTLPEITPDIGRLVREPLGYFREDYRLIFTWSYVLVGGAVLTAWLLSVISEKVRRLRDPKIGLVSAWYRMFDDPENDVYCWCELNDGSAFGGVLFSFSTEIRETGDRDLVLAGPLKYRSAGVEEISVLPSESVILSARSIGSIVVTYLLPVGKEASRLKSDGSEVSERDGLEVSEREKEAAGVFSIPRTSAP